MSGRPWPNAVLLSVLVVLSAVALAMVVPTATGGGEQSRKTADDVKLVEPRPNGSQQLWPFTSRERRFESLTLPINMVFLTDAATTRYLLTSEGDENWENHSARYKDKPTFRLDAPNSSAQPTESDTPAEANRTNATAESAASNRTNATATNQTNATAEPSPTDTPTGFNQTNATITDTSNTSAEPNGTNVTATNRTNETATNESRPAIIINGTELGWRRTHGGTRYTYVRTVNGDGQWIDATYQLHNGDYFGSRTHLRLYEGGPENREWTAIQAHREHWDWFGLRHSVGSLSRARHQVERQFYDKWYVTGISRQRYGNGGALDAYGWVSVVDFRDNVQVPPRLFLLPFVLGLAASRRAASVLDSAERDVRRLWEGDRTTRNHLGLFLVVAALPLVVRNGAIAVEQSYPNASPFLVGGPFYLLLVLGLPVAAALLSRPLDPVDAFALTVVGLGTGIMLDYVVIGVTLLEFGVVLHRLTVLMALGTIAAAAAGKPEDDWRGSILVVGVLAWVAVILGPVLGLG